METKQIGNQLFSLHSFALVLILGAGAYLSHTALKSSRPSVPKTSQLESRKEAIECRLWQDPIRVVYEEIVGQRETEKENRISCIQSDIKELLTKTKYNKEKPVEIPVLLTMIRGGDSAEDYEDRLRGRQAILAALRRVDLKPENTEHISYFTEKPDASKISDGNEPKSNIIAIPYEWFSRDELALQNDVRTKANIVLLLWLRDDFFTDNPLQLLKQLTEKLNRQFDLPEEQLRPTFNVLGPTESTTLRTMLEEDFNAADNDPNNTNNDANNADNNPNMIRIYSPWSTATPAVLTYNLTKEDKSNSKTIREILKQKGFNFIRMIGTDYHLVDCLRDELSRRGVDIEDQQTHVALISEWGSFYCQAFSLIFALQKSGGGELLFGVLEEYKTPDFSNLINKVKTDKNISENFHIFQYVRGIDGKLPAKPLSKTTTSKEKPQSESQPQAEEAQGLQPQLTEAPELPTGRSQLDYIRRLARSLAERYKCPSSKGRLKAIGIVSSDVYDKLLLLHALREEFGDVIFFTTDLDARLMHHDNFKWTRNLIVASNYGLALNEYYQPLTLRFRDNYQTSLYFACLKAIELTGEPDYNVEESVKELQEQFRIPRLFEIGRDCAVDLSVEPEDFSSEQRIHPPVPIKDDVYIKRAKRYLFCIFMILFLLLLLFTYVSKNLREPLAVVFTRRKQRKEKSQKQENEQEESSSEEQIIRREHYPVFVIGSLILIIAFIIIVYNDNFRFTGERISFLKGFSVWPCEALRLIALILSVFFLMKARIDLDRNEEQIIKDFFESDCRESEYKVKPWESLREWKRKKGSMLYWKRDDLKEAWKSLRKYWSENISFYSWKQDQKGKAQDLWTEYLKRGVWSCRVIRLIPTLLIYISLCFILVWTFGAPACPYRGQISRWADTIILVPTIFLMLVLIFFVVDATQLCAKFIELLKKETDWSLTLTNLHHRIQEYLNEREIGKMEKEFDEWLDIKLIASRTEEVGKLIYYPFIVLLVMVVSRSRIFDNWDWPKSLILIFAMNMIFALYCAIRMRGSAEKARRQAIQTLQENLALIEGQDDVRSKKIRVMIDDITSIKQGAFSPFSENPVIGAILIPSGGITLLALLQVLS